MPGPELRDEEAALIVHRMRERRRQWDGQAAPRTDAFNDAARPPTRETDFMGAECATPEAAIPDQRFVAVPAAINRSRDHFPRSIVMESLLSRSSPWPLIVLIVSAAITRQANPRSGFRLTPDDARAGGHAITILRRWLSTTLR